MKEMYLKLAQKEVEVLKSKFDGPKAYHEFINGSEYREALENDVTEEELEDLFPKPVGAADGYPEENESGDPLTVQEFSLSPDDYKLTKIDKFGWLQDLDLRNKLINDEFYREYVRKSLGNIPDEVKDSIELHSLHILGRCNNPVKWETDSVKPEMDVPENWMLQKEVTDEMISAPGTNDYWYNKQGLVYGMVQSGKTASMISLIGLAKTAGFRLFIILSGDKTSLRDQTQKRVNEAFNLNSMGMSKNGQRIRSLTTSHQDYGAIRDANRNALNLWNDVIVEDHTIIICVKKESSNLRKLREDLEELKQVSESGMLANFDFVGDLKALIIDDEADYGSQNTSRSGLPSPLHQKIVDLREVLVQNTYVAYTATPQACLGADPKALVGYPRDFIWLLDPYRDNEGYTTTYLGLEEFFTHYPSQLIKGLPKSSWPYWHKVEGRRIGIYKEDGSIDESRLEDAEIEAVKKFIKDDKLFNENCDEYTDALVQFVITCAVRWYRHYRSCQAAGHFVSDLPTKTQIRGAEKGDFKEFPYHAIMFNLSRLTGVQRKIVKLVEKIMDKVKLEYHTSKESRWSSDGRVERVYREQLDKSRRFDRSIPDISELEYFMDMALSIAGDSIPGEGNYIYLLNSQDEGQTLRYGDKNILGRPKKASIIVGGNILARGLTIENLSVSVFARSQVMSLGDTNLQMCRWFGHKKQDVDLHSVFMQDHSRELFTSIAKADRELRDQFWYHISIDTPAKCILLEMQNNPLFRVTSPAKSLFLERSDKTSFSGRTLDCLEPMKHPKYLTNNKLLDSYLERLSVSKEYMHDRAWVYKSVDQTEFLNFFKSLNVHEDADFVSPEKFVEYMDEWKKDKGSIPNINIAVFGIDKDGNEKLRERARMIPTGSKEPSKKLGSLRGGKSQGVYLGDQFVDKSKKFHDANMTKKFLKRSQIDGILVIFYKLDHNYISKTVQIKKGEQGYQTEPLVTFSVSTPIGGPKYSVFTNRGVRHRQLAIETECDAFFESVNINNE